ncbi:hypothetical protein ABT112_27380 [Streptomyces sp. NPDC002055]|uniref:hypothetical protein n=1 Tax=Streptomyces sp. NPDC002055 TaxID=3154534 RepID=UPI0033271AB0
MTEFVSCGLRCHEEWVSIPTEPGADITAWVDEQAKELVERSVADGTLLDEDLLRQDLRERAADSRGRKRVHAFALYVNGLEESTALLEVDFIHPDETVARITLDWIAERFSTDDFGAPDITHARVPLGEAVRIRQNFAAGDSGRDSERCSWRPSHTVLCRRGATAR